MNDAHELNTTINLLPGDSMMETFRMAGIEGRCFVFRECLIVGDVNLASEDEFFQAREDYLSEFGSREFYSEKVRLELVEFAKAAKGAIVNLWFEYEAFCQVNLWFAIDLIGNSAKEIYIVYPKRKHLDSIWDGFGMVNQEQLKESFYARIRLSEAEIIHAKELWRAFAVRDWKQLRDLGETNSAAFPTLDIVTEAISEIEIRPPKIIREAIANGANSFSEVFKYFRENAGIYGLGDIQVKTIYEELKNLEKKRR